MPVRFDITARLRCAVLLVAVGMLATACGSSTQGSSPGPPSPVYPSAASTSTSPQPSLATVHITVAGTDKAGATPVTLTEEDPAGWTAEPFGGYRGSSGPPAGTGHFYSLVDDTFTDPCAHVSRNPKIGSTVGDLATALGQIPDITATAPVQATIAGHPATYVELSVPASLPCAPNEFYLWQDSPDGDWWVEGLNETIGVWIVEVRGQRMAVATRTWPGTSEQAKAELQGILDSIVFDGGW